jgi:predicted outer membrane repeat protein
MRPPERPWPRSLIPALLVLLGVGPTVTPAAGAVLRVQPDGRGPYPTIQAAVDAAAPGDLIRLVDGVYSGPGNRDVDLRGKAVHIVAAGDDPAACVIDCTGGDREALHRGFLFRSGEGSNSGLRGLTLRHGRVTGGPGEGAGGAVLCRAASPSIERCVFEFNRAELGGALACSDGAAPRITNCSFRQNTAAQGGALQCLEAAPILNGCSFVLNTADRGGGLECYRASPELHGCIFDRNSGEGGGGIMCEADSAPIIENGLFCGNIASIGGALFVQDSTPRVDRCTFAVNSAGSGAGVNWLAGGGVRLYRCIIAFSTQGEALACSTNRDLDVSCCLIWGNAGGDWVGCLRGEDGRQGNVRADPLFRRPAHGDFRLRAASPGRGGAAGCELIGAEDPRLSP